MKKKSTPKGPRLLDKHLIEAGQQCQKRLWLDYHQPTTTEPSAVRQAMSAAGEQLRALARVAFPKGVSIEGKDAEAAAAATREQLAAGTPVLFGATFVADGVEARSDILVVHKDGAMDLFEVKSGTKVNPRYVADLALQAHVLAACGHKLRATYLLTVNPKYAHKEGADYPPMQLLRSADVTAKVQRHVEAMRRRLQVFQRSIADEGVLQLPTGTFCTSPLPCPHLERCRKEGPELPLRELPELTRPLEQELHKEGIEDLRGLDRNREGLTPRQKRTLEAVQENKTIVEPFVESELKQCSKPLHFLAIAGATEALPRFDAQRPWRFVPYGWAAHTVHADGRVETASFVHVERTDPRPGFATSLQKHLEVGGTIVCWNDEVLDELRGLLEDLPNHKAAARAVVSQSHIDLMQLLEEGLFHPQLRSYTDLRQSVAVLLGDKSGDELAVFGEEALVGALAKAQAPRVRSTTRDKIAADVLAGLTWTCERLRKLYETYGGMAAPPPKPKPPTVARAAKPLPKPLPKPAE